MAFLETYVLTSDIPGIGRRVGIPIPSLDFGPFSFTPGSHFVTVANEGAIGISGGIERQLIFAGAACAGGSSVLAKRITIDLV